jgi:hypothetical protein
MPTPNRIPTTAKNSRRYLPLPAEANDERGHGGELDAVQAIWNAYLACNATGTSLASIPYGDKFHPMNVLARAAVEALARIEGVGHRGAETIWQHMGDNGDGARWNYDLWRKGDI